MAGRNTVIIGFDAISPLGRDLDEQWQHALQGQSGVGPLTRFTVDNEFPVKIAGQVPEIDDLDYPFLTARHQAAWSSPIFKYGMLTVERALAHSCIEITPELAPRVGVTYSSAVGGLDAVLNADRHMREAGKLPPPYTNPNSCINMVGGKIAMQTGATGPILSTITACATGLTSMLTGAMLIDQNRADMVICGAVDFALVEPIVAGFSTMNGAYNPKPGHENDPPETASRPFSEDRRGFIISEGAGAVILASADFASVHGLKPHIGLQGWSMTSDAHHFVAPHYPTVRRCMTEAIKDAGVTPSDIAAVNAHAASTRAGDKVEADALHAVFKNDLPPVCANKSLMGHCMGASSAIESILAFKGMLDSQVPPTLNYTPDPEIELDCVAEGRRPLAQEFILKNSFGFGGCNSCAVFRRLD
jgi:3-oxoacyl-[acyl-carrier-protein] synthase II